MSDDPRKNEDFWQNAHAERFAWEKRQKDLFAAATGISHHGLKWSNHWSTVTAQREKIASLKRQMREMHNGYRRKIARLEAKLTVLQHKLSEKGDD